MASWLVTHRGSPPVENRYGIEVNNGNGDGNESHEFPEMFRPRISHTCFLSVARIELRLDFSQGKPSTSMDLAEACGTAASRIWVEPRVTTVPQMHLLFVGHLSHLPMSCSQDITVQGSHLCIPWKLHETSIWL